MRDKIIKILIFVLPLIVWIIWNVYWISENYDYCANDVIAHLLGERDVYSRISSEFRYNGIVNGIKLVSGGRFIRF